MKLQALLCGLLLFTSIGHAEQPTANMDFNSSELQFYKSMKPEEYQMQIDHSLELIKFTVIESGSTMTTVLKSWKEAGVDIEMKAAVCMMLGMSNSTIIDKFLRFTTLKDSQATDDQKALGHELSISMVETTLYCSSPNLTGKGPKEDLAVAILSAANLMRKIKV